MKIPLISSLVFVGHASRLPLRDYPQNDLFENFFSGFVWDDSGAGVCWGRGDQEVTTEYWLGFVRSYW